MILIIISGKRIYELFCEISIDSLAVVLDVDAIPASFKGGKKDMYTLLYSEAVF